MLSTLRLSLCFTLSLSLLAVGCGEDAAPTGTAADAVAADSAAADSTTADVADTAAADTAVADTTGTSTDTSATPDVAAPSSPCSDLLGCALACAPGAGWKACAADCAKTGSDAAKTQMQDLGNCVTDLCSDATSTTAVIGCAASQCYDKLATCGKWTGTSNCAQTMGCASRCPLNDDACRAACLAAASATAAKTYGTIAGCAAKSCAGSANPAAYAACVASQCSAPVETCKGDGFTCVQLAGCKAKCPTSLPNKPNACLEFCDLFSTATAVSQDDAYTACKDSCKGARGGGPECIAKQCSETRLACFPDDGTDTCAKIYKNVVDKCGGIGGDAGCIEAEIAKGSSLAKEAFLTYEGCIQIQLKTDVAETSGCSYPYDQKTCIDVLTGYCGSAGPTCFKQN
jgi:hypothetical protein